MAKGLSINVGLNRVDPAHYRGWEGRLFACEHDARDMSALAQANGLPSTLLLTADATAKNVTDAIAGAAEQLGADDLLFLTYSGHGGQVPDAGAENEEDAQDETWMLYDRQLIDDELYALWSAFASGTRILVLSDSCHSGTATRGAAEDAAELERIIEADRRDDDGTPRVRAAPPVISRATFEDHRDLYAEVKRAQRENPGDVGAQVLLLSGCQDDQVSKDGSRNGLFTARLREVWADGAFTGDHRRLHQEIAARMPGSQTPNYFCAGRVTPAFEAQRPLSVAGAAA